MKRRTRMRIFRSAVTGSFVMLVIAMAAWSKDGRSGEHAASAAQAAADAAARACQSRVQPELHGQVDRWQRVDQDVQPDGVAVTFVADVAGKTTTYRCEAAPAGLAVAVEP